MKSVGKKIPVQTNLLNNLSRSGKVVRIMRADCITSKRSTSSCTACWRSIITALRQDGLQIHSRSNLKETTSIVDGTMYKKITALQSTLKYFFFYLLPNAVQQRSNTLLSEPSPKIRKFFIVTASITMLFA